jgi:Zn-dependent peptidase ImmA (M78 family)/DNA-binding XRE family transcriptional regulator
MHWAREKARLTTEQASKKIGRPKEEIKAWEDGILRPTIPQARKASEVYKRPLAVFYLPEPPKDFDTLRDFRSLPVDYEPDYSPELALLIRTAKFRQKWTREFFIDEGVSKLSFVGSSSLDDSPQKVSHHILSHLHLSPEEQIKCHTRNEALRLWIDRAERAGIIIFRQGNIDLKETRGFILCDEYAPFIFINSEDAIAAQLFTLVHELAHLWLNQTGISNLEPFKKIPKDEDQKIELFCNKIASEALLKRKLFYHSWRDQDPSLSLKEQIENVSNIFKVSEEAISRRLLDDGTISLNVYLELREFYQNRWVEFKERERQRMKSTEGGPSYYVRKVFNNGYSFTQTVISAFDSGAITGRDASNLLDVKISNIRRLASVAGMVF